MNARGHRLYFVVAGAIGVLCAAPVRANGRHGEQQLLSGVAKGKGVALNLETTADVLQLMGTLGGKYHLFRIVIRNVGSAGTNLARATTSAQLRLEYPATGAMKTVTAIVDLGKHDPDFWRDVTPWQRSVFRFPEQIGAGETDSLIIAVAASDLDADAEPRVLAIALKLLDRISVTLKRPAVAKK